MSSRHLRWLITCRLVAQPCWSPTAGNHDNSHAETEIPRISNYSISFYQTTVQLRICWPERCWLPGHPNPLPLFYLFTLYQTCKGTSSALMLVYFLFCFVCQLRVLSPLSRTTRRNSAYTRAPRITGSSIRRTQQPKVLVFQTHSCTQLTECQLTQCDPSGLSEKKAW